MIQEIHRRGKSPAQPKPSTHEHQCTSTSARDKPRAKVISHVKLSCDQIPHGIMGDKTVIKYIKMSYFHPCNCEWKSRGTLEEKTYLELSAGHSLSVAATHAEEVGDGLLRPHPVLSGPFSGGFTDEEMTQLVTLLQHSTYMNRVPTDFL